MSTDAYELAALTMRYVFAGLMVLIVLRAVKGAVTDSQRAAKLRRLSPMTGLSGELVVLEGDQRAKRGMRYPVIREGMIGTSRRADIRVRHSTVRRRHAYFQLAEDGLHVRTHAGTRLHNADGRTVRELILADGDSFYIGDVRLLLVLNVPDAPVRTVREHHDDEPMTSSEDDLFHTGDWTDEEEEIPRETESNAQYHRPEPPRKTEPRRVHREPVVERDPGFDPEDNIPLVRRDPMADVLEPAPRKHASRGTFPEDDDPFDVFMDGQDDDDF